MKITTAYHDQTYILDNGTKVSTLLSTDSGVAFIVKTSDGAIYHAGDLNDWHWEGETETDNRHMTSMYCAEINKIISGKSYFAKMLFFYNILLIRLYTRF